MTAPRPAVSLRSLEDRAAFLLSGDASFHARHDSAPQQLPNAAIVGLRNEVVALQLALAARRLVLEVMTDVRLFVDELPRTGLANPLRSSGVRFHLRHVRPPLP